LASIGFGITSRRGAFTSHKISVLAKERTLPALGGEPVEGRQEGVAPNVSAEALDVTVTG
jgi:hypothetical protein